MKIYMNFLIGLLIGASLTAASISMEAPVNSPTNSVNQSLASLVNITETNVPEVPFYSQFEDISDPEWQKLGCGIADLAMLIEFYKPEVTVSVNSLLQEGIAAEAFVQGAGWSHWGLVSLAQKYGLQGEVFNWADLNKEAAFSKLSDVLQEGPAIASVYYKMEPGNPIPHLVVINGIKNGKVFYNDPAETFGGYEISIEDFMQAWKKRLIVIRPI